MNVREPGWTLRLSSMIVDRPAEEVLGQVTEEAVASAPGSDGCAIVVIDGDRVLSRATTGELSERAMAHERATAEGPAATAVAEACAVEVADLTAEIRWPAFRALAEHDGLMAVYAVPLRTSRGVIGSLTLHSTAAPFDAGDRRRIDELARAVAVSVWNVATFTETRREIHQLQEALASRDLIGQAKGVVMATMGCDAEEAFTLLRRRSQAHNEKLRDVAASVVAHRTWPLEAPGYRTDHRTDRPPGPQGASR